MGHESPGQVGWDPAEWESLEDGPGNSGKSQAGPGKTGKAAYWHVLRCPDALENHWSVCRTRSFKKQKAGGLLAMVENVV